MLSQLTRYASEFDLSVQKAELDIRIAYDQRRKLMLSDESPAAQQVTYTWDIESESAPERVAEALRWIEKGCHTLCTLREPVPVAGKAQLNGADLAFADSASG